MNMVLAIVFNISGSAYALPCHCIIEVVPLVELRPLPQAPRWLVGSFAYHGALVSVVDACQLIGGYACSRRLSSRVAIVHCSLPEQGEVIVGVLAERMTAVRRLDGPTLVSGESTPVSYLGNVVKQGAELVQLVDIAGMVRATRYTAFEAPALPIGGALE